MATNDKPRNIVHIHPDDDLVIHWDLGMVLLSKARLTAYEVSGSPPKAIFEGVWLRTVLPPGTKLQVAEVQPENVGVAVDQLKAPEAPVLQD